MKYPDTIINEITKTSGKTSGKTSEKIINAVRLNPQITIAELSQLTGVTTRSVERNLEVLKKMKRLQRIGSDKDGYWELIID